MDAIHDEIVFSCHACGAEIVLPAARCGHVETCPHCDSYVDVPKAAADGQMPAGVVRREAARQTVPQTRPRSRAALGIEIVAVLCLAWFPDLFNAVMSLEWNGPSSSVSANGLLFILVRSLQVSAPLLVIIRLSDQPWSRFGLVRPRWIADGLAGFALCIGAGLSASLVMLLLQLPWAAGSASLWTAEPPGPARIQTGILIVLTSVANGFTEELAMRGYLIPRLEQYSGSTWFAVTMSTLLFASYHVYQGAAPTIGVAVVGLVYGIAFCRLRRLGPLCVAHTLTNMLTM